VSVLLQFLESSLDFIRNALATKLDAVIGEASRVAFRDEDVEIGVSLTDRGGEELQVVRVTPKPGSLAKDHFVNEVGGESGPTTFNVPVNQNDKVGDFS
jgi:hypothetical protein